MIFQRLKISCFTTAMLIGLFPRPADLMTSGPAAKAGSFIYAFSATALAPRSTFILEPESDPLAIARARLPNLKKIKMKIFRLAAKGLSSAEIASALGRNNSPRTIGTHLAQIYRILGLTGKQNVRGLLKELAKKGPKHQARPSVKDALSIRTFASPPTDREKDILRLLMLRHSPSEAAYALNLSDNTVLNMLRLMHTFLPKKARLGSRPLFAAAVQAGVTPPPLSEMGVTNIPSLLERYNEDLTPLQHRLIKGLLDGMSNKELAKSFCKGRLWSVKALMKNIHDVLGIENSKFLWSVLYWLNQLSRDPAGKGVSAVPRSPKRLRSSYS